MSDSERAFLRRTPQISKIMLMIFDLLWMRPVCAGKLQINLLSLTLKSCAGSLEILNKWKIKPGI